MDKEPKSDRVFNRHGRRHYRRSYSKREVWIGLAILSALGVVAAWVIHRGAHPEPELFDNQALLDPGKPPVVDRGVLPEDLVVGGYREGPIAHFGPDNLFEKINGRADFFKSRGFVGLTCVSLQHADPERSVDIELYDMGTSQQALGTYAVERPDGVELQRGQGSLYHLEPSALFMARGQYYVRVLAASHADPVPEELAHLVEVLNGSLAGTKWSWSEDMFVDCLALAPSDLGFVAENAFSFGFARGVHTARLSEVESDLFVVPNLDEEAAAKLEGHFLEGFQSYGETETRAGHVFVVDRYQKRISSVGHIGEFTYGIVGAPDWPVALPAVDRLHFCLSRLPDRSRAAALSEVASGAQNGAKPGDSGHGAH